MLNWGANTLKKGTKVKFKANEQLMQGVVNKIDKKKELYRVLTEKEDGSPIYVMIPFHYIGKGVEVID